MNPNNWKIEPSLFDRVVVFVFVTNKEIQNALVRSDFIIKLNVSWTLDKEIIVNSLHVPLALPSGTDGSIVGVNNSCSAQNEQIHLAYWREWDSGNELDTQSVVSVVMLLCYRIVFEDK